MKRLLIAIVVLGAIGAGIGYYMYNKPVASLDAKKADVEVTAEEIINHYSEDETKANTTYLGKVVQVSGTVAQIMDEGGKKKIHLDAGNPMSVVICEMEDGHATTSIAAGQNVKLKGMCSGYLSDVVLVQTVVVE